MPPPPYILLPQTLSRSVLDASLELALFSTLLQIRDLGPPFIDYADYFETEGVSGEKISNSTDDKLMEVMKCMGISMPNRVRLRAKFKEWCSEDTTVASTVKSNRSGIVDAVQLHNVSLVMRLLASNPELVNELDEYFSLFLLRTLLLVACLPSRRNECTPLHWSAVEGNIEIVKAFLAARADPNMKEK